MPRFEPLLLHARNPGPMTGDGNNTYLLTDSRQSVLIDAGVGHPEHLADLQRAVRDVGAPLQTLVVTHGHSDHASGAPSLVGLFAATVCWKLLRPGDESHGPVHWHPLHDGDAIRFGSQTLKVIHTPGHAPDHIALWHEGSASLFSGDLVIPGRSVAIDTAGGGRMADYLRSLEHIRKLSPHQLFPAHGPVVPNPERIIATHLAHRLEREQQVVEALAAGKRTVEAIADSIYDRLDGRLLAAARGNVRAHLEKLQAEGRAADHDGGWTLNT